MIFAGDPSATRVVDDRSRVFQVGSRTDYSRVEMYNVGTSTRLTYQFDFCIIRASMGPAVGLAAYGRIEGSGGNDLHFNGQGFINFCDNWGAGVRVGQWEANTWHTYKVEIDFEAGTANVYIDGALVKENVKAARICNTNPPRPFDAFSINGGHSNTGQGNLFLIDNIVLSR